MKKLLAKIFILSFSVCSTNLSFGQNFLNIRDFVVSTNQFEQKHASEKIYIHTDKPNYASNDTLWLKAYLFEANTYTASDKSKILYVEIANDSNAVIKRIMLPVVSGMTFGNIFLDEEQFKQGGYIIRAYTNWMRNFNEDIVFQKHFYINRFNDTEWLINYSVNQLDSIKNGYQLNLQVKKFEGSGLILNGLEISLTDENKRVFKDKLKTDINGNIDLTFKIPEKVEKKKLTLTLLDLQKKEEQKMYSFPLALNSTNDIDLQFMPESGQLIDGIQSKVGFKALNSLGLGTYVSGELFEEGNPQKVLTFKSDYLGMGTFSFTPIFGKKYFAKLIPYAKNAAPQTYPLPLIKEEGLVIVVENPPEEGSINISIRKKGISIFCCQG